MTATYNQAEIIYGTSRLTYNGEADDTAGVGRPRIRETGRRTGVTTSAPRPSVAVTGRSQSVRVTAPRPAVTVSAPRPSVTVNTR